MINVTRGSSGNKKSVPVKFIKQNGEDADVYMKKGEILPSTISLRR